VLADLLRIAAGVDGGSAPGEAVGDRRLSGIREIAANIDWDGEP
jgi:hypothetical protein